MVGENQEADWQITLLVAGLHLGNLRHGDNLNVMRSLPAGRAATVFADPPYNCGWKYREDKGGDRLRDAVYLPLMQAWRTALASRKRGDLKKDRY